MTSADILRVINDIFLDVFDFEELKIDENTSAKDVEGWDSLTHIRLMVAIERKFKVKFTNPEIETLGSVGDLVKLIKYKLDNSPAVQ
jgi:acyl carrier protein